VVQIHPLSPDFIHQIFVGYQGGMSEFTEPRALINLIDYQTGSVVSKTVVDKPSGTVTLFAFDKGQGLSEHTAPFDALVYMVDGKAEIKISGNPLQVNAGQMVVMPANKPHALRAINQFKMLLVMIKS
jgi:quercetin dioxygenase-like cupin family protein